MTAPRLRRSAPAPKPGVVHLGLGAFFRAHGAVYLQDVMAREGGDWGVIGVSLQRPDQRDRLKPQDCVYTAVEKRPDGDAPRVIDCVVDVLVAPENPGAVVAAMADPAIRIVTLTVTEKGYCHIPATGRLNREHPGVVHDLAHPDAPVTAPGFLVAALARRRAAGLRPFTVLCCDNLPSNGHVVRGLTLELAAARDQGLADWIAAEGAFPCTMVDRIVPATRPEDTAALEAAAGWSDAAPVVHEPFRQWVIEDRFVDGARPDFAAVGARFTDDVAAFEHMKLRMLNGAHSSLAYLGHIAGVETIHGAVSDPVLAGFVRGFWAEEVIPTLATPPGADLPAYADALFDRFANPAIRHLTWQIAMDGSQKLPQRLMGTARDLLAANRPLPRLALAVAGWMAYVGGKDEAGRPIDVRDPLAERLRALSAGKAPAERVANLLTVREIFGDDLPADPRFASAVAEAAQALAAMGARGAAAAI
ncbi:MAG: mannitol dehydrogenase family protein [Rubrimonas sp.]